MPAVCAPACHGARAGRASATWCRAAGRRLVLAAVAEQRQLQVRSLPQPPGGEAEWVVLGQHDGAQQFRRGTQAARPVAVVLHLQQACGQGVDGVEGQHAILHNGLEYMGGWGVGWEWRGHGEDLAHLGVREVPREWGRGQVRGRRSRQRGARREIGGRGRR